MNPSAFSKITAKLVDLLQAGTPAAEMIYRARRREVPEKVQTAISVQFIGAVPMSVTIKDAPIDWSSKFTVECLARSKTEGGDEAVDPLLMEVYQRIAANPTLDGLVGYIGEPTIEADYSAEGDKTGWVCMTYTAEHRTENSTLE